MPRATSALVTVLPLRRRGELAPEKPWSEGEAPAEYEIEVERATRVLIREMAEGVEGAGSSGEARVESAHNQDWTDMVRAERSVGRLLRCLVVGN